MSGKNLETLAGHFRKYDSLSIRNILSEIVANWHWFSLSLTASSISACIYLRYTTPQYLVTASLLISDESRGAEFGDAFSLENFGLTSQTSSIDNEIEILKSRSLLEKVVVDLQLNIQYFAEGRLKMNELYEKSPFKLTLLKSVDVRKPSTYRLKVIDQKHYALQTSDQNFQGRFGDTIVLPQGPAMLRKTNYQQSSEDQYFILISVKEQVIKKYRDMLTVSATNKMASVVQLAITEELPFKGEVILGELLDNYLKSSIADKNRIADSTIVFINRNLKEVSSELVLLEKDIEHFRSENRLVNLPEHARLLLENSGQYSKEENAQLIRLKILESVQSDLQKHADCIVPSSLFQQSPGFTGLVQKYNEMQLLRKKLVTTTSESNPIVRSTDAQLASLRADLVTEIIAQKTELKVSLRALDQYNKTIETQISEIPHLEKVYVDYTRQQQIKQDLYLFLLKKRVETAISRSANIANGRIIDPPKSEPTPVKPSKQLVLLLAGMIGFAIPLTFLHLKNLFNDRVRAKIEIVENCPAAILGEISQQKSILTNTFDSEKRGIISEQFRALRTNIQFLNVNKRHQTILITSSMGGEGKSFIAVNLCHSLALSGKQVILVELDLRKPTLARYLNLADRGFSDLLTSHKNLTDYIQKTSFTPPFDVITSGHPPPDPVEMLTIPKVAEIIATLRQTYDHIIFDTPPIGLVTDARLLSCYADLSLYVVRQQVTFREQLNDINKICADSQFPNMHIILNGITQQTDYQYNYGYDHQKKRWLTYLFNKIKHTRQNT